MGSLAAALGPAAFFFFLPMRVVGCGGGSYFGLSFCNECQHHMITDRASIMYLVLFVLVVAGRAAASSARLLVALRIVSMRPNDLRREASPP